MRSSWDRGLFSDAFRREVVNREKSWESFPGGFSSAHAALLYRTARSRYLAFVRESNNKTSANLGMESASPFLDRDLLSFIMAIPGEVVSVQELKKKLLRSAMDRVLPDLIAVRRGKATFGNLINPIVREDLQKHLLRGSGTHGMIQSVKYFNLEKVPIRSSKDFGLIAGNDLTPAKQYCDLLGMEVWLDVFF
jgi:asparagine synthetase B (glutamine-hydrolysing)